MVPEDLVFWLAPIADAPTPDPNLLCRRHADTMVVPRGWLLDDRREATPRLFSAHAARASDPEPAPSRRARSRAARDDALPRPEQLQIDGTAEIARPVVPDRVDVPDPGDPVDAGAIDARSDPDGEPWLPAFDTDDDLGGLLEVTSPLLARAFRGTGRPRRDT